MNTRLLTIAVACLGASSLVAADKPKIVAASPTNGVFFTYGWHNLVIELKDGKFRYWFSSDLGGGDVESLEGTYTSEGDKIVLKHQKLIPLMSNWTVRSINGVVTLWRSDALTQLERGDNALNSVGEKKVFFQTGGGSILVPSKRTAEEAWTYPQLAGLSEAEYKAFIERQNRRARAEEAEQAVAPNGS